MLIKTYQGSLNSSLTSNRKCLSIPDSYTPLQPFVIALREEETPEVLSSVGNVESHGLDEGRVLCAL